MNTTALDVEELVRLAQLGTLAEQDLAWEQIWKDYVPSIRRYFVAMNIVEDFDELTIETFGRAFKVMHRFEYRGVDLLPWLRSIAEKIRLEHLRRLESRQLNEESLESYAGSELITLDHLYPDLDSQDLREIVAQKLKNFPDRYQVIVEAIMIDGMSVQEVA